VYKHSGPSMPEIYTDQSTSRRLTK